MIKFISPSITPSGHAAASPAVKHGKLNPLAKIQHHIKSQFERLKSQYERLLKLKPVNFFIIHKIDSLGKSSLKTISGIINASKGVFGEVIDKETAVMFARGQGFTEVLRHISYVAIPFDVYFLGDSLVRLFKKKFADEKIDAALNISRSLAYLGSTAVAIGNHLSSVGVIATESLSWVQPLSITSLALSAAAIGIGVKGLVESKHLSKKFDAIHNKNFLTSQAEFRQLKASLLKKSNGFLSQHFQIRPRLLKSELEVIELRAEEKIRSGDAKLMMEGMQDFEKVNQGIRKRIAASYVSSILRTVAAIISVIGVSVLLFTPVAPAGYALLAVSGSVMVAKFFFDRIKTNQFAKTIRTTPDSNSLDLKKLKVKISNFSSKMKDRMNPKRFFASFAKVKDCGVKITQENKKKKSYKGLFVVSWKKPLFQQRALITS